MGKRGQMSDDISFCLDAYDIPCDKHDCERHPCNIVDRLIPHSYMNFYGTEFCKKGKQMNFSDKIKDEEFMNLPEVEEDIEEEELEEEDDDFQLPPFLDLLNHKEPTREEDIANRKEKADRNIEIFLYVNDKLKDLGFEDKEERYRIIEQLF